MFSNAPVALRWTLISFDLASLVNGANAPDLAIFALLSSCVARFVIQPTALHCTSTFGDIICRISGESPPSITMATLFSAINFQHYIPMYVLRRGVLLTARFPRAALAARCTSMSGLCKRNNIGSRVVLSTSLTSVHGISHGLVPGLGYAYLAL